MTERARPIRPDEVMDERLKRIPEEVIETFNYLIIRGRGINNIRVYEDEVIDRLINKGLDPMDILWEGWLNIGEIYQMAGWRVERGSYEHNQRNLPCFDFRRLKPEPGAE